MDEVRKNHCECPDEKFTGGGEHVEFECPSKPEHLQLIKREGSIITLCGNCTLPGDIRLDE